jgi:hypothetical protein
MNEIKLPYDKIPRDPRILDADIGDMVQIPCYTAAMPPALALLDSLDESGVILPRTADVVASIENAFDDIGDVRAVEVLAVIFDRLPDTKAGHLLRLALRGAIATESDAAPLGITRQGLAKNLERLKKRLRIAG